MRPISHGQTTSKIHFHHLATMTPEIQGPPDMNSQLNEWLHIEIFSLKILLFQKKIGCIGFFRVQRGSLGIRDFLNIRYDPDPVLVSSSWEGTLAPRRCVVG